jgi:hypothetical protein
MPASPLSAALIDRAAVVAKARGVAVRIEARGVTVTVLPESPAAPQDAPEPDRVNSCDAAFR